jgi:Flp pilus assembly protein TadD
MASAGRNLEAAEELFQAHDSHAFALDAELALGCALALQGKYGKAAARVRCAIAAEPKHGLAHLLLGWFLLADSRPHQAIEPLKVAQALFGSGTPATSALGFAMARAGRVGAARDILEDLRHGSAGRFQVDADAGIVHLGLGEEQEARSCFRTALQKHSGRIGILHFTPELEGKMSVWLTGLLSKSMVA